MGTLLRRCVEMRTAIELSFGVVSVVGPGIGVLDGVMCCKEKGEGVREVSRSCWGGLSIHNC